MKTPAEIAAYFHDSHPVMLDEVTYKDLMHAIDPRDLPHRDYAPLIPYVNYVETEKSTMQFFVPNGHNGWPTFIRYVEWKRVLADTSLNATDAARMLLWAANIQIHCPCPAFKFWGMQYIATQLDAAIVPEVRYPHIRNPELKGIACKHLRRTIKVLPFHLGDMAKAIKQQRRG